jgi:hypothetical protein
MLHTARLTFLVGLSAVVLLALLLVSWLIYMPVMALLVSPFTLLSGAVLGVAPSAAANSAAAVVLAAALACATVASVLRVLLRRARARRRHAPRIA